MTRRQDVQKGRVWAERLERYRASGLTVARFCARERVSMHTFYYWSKRIAADLIAASSSSRGEPAGQARAAVGAGQPAVVRFHLSAAVEVSVPADCLDAIRCLAQCVQLRRAEGAGAFQEVLVATR